MDYTSTSRPGSGSREDAATRSAPARKAPSRKWADTQIATWLVTDSKEEATFCPQLGAQSDAPDTLAAYWRCVAVSLASSLAVNPDLPHYLYTNSPLPVIDDVSIAELLDGWGVQVVPLPVTFRLALGEVTQWGNQFYVFDILRDFATRQDSPRLILLDSDCLWIRRADAISAAIDRHGALTYPLGPEEHNFCKSINGLTRADLARYLARNGGRPRGWIDYCGGEILAVDRGTASRILHHARDLWPGIQAAATTAPREEAHLLSVIYDLEKVKMGTANPFIRRLWTGFRRNNLAVSDRQCTIWHLPAEKRTGFRDLFRQIVRSSGCDPRSDSVAMGLTFRNYCRAMGWPRRGPAKFARDLSLKLADKFG